MYIRKKQLYVLKTLVFIPLFLCLLTNVNGQSQSPSFTMQVIGSAGDFTADSTKSLSWTVGEIMVKTFSDTTNFLTQGFQQPWENNLADTQLIELPLGWSLFSTYIIPEDPFVPSVMSELSADISIMKDGDGYVYWPIYGLNLIGDLIIGKGYQIRMEVAHILTVIGTEVIPEETPVPIELSWSIIGYLRKNPAPPDSVLSEIEHIIIILKNASGMVYWPEFNLNLIGNLEPGQGYQLNSSTDTIFYYPPNNVNYSKSIIDFQQCTHFPLVSNSETNLTLGIPWNAWDIPPRPGDEIAVYSNSGILAGSAVFQSNMLTIPVWGDDSYTYHTDGVLDNEEFYIVVWHQETNSEEILVVEEWIEGDGQYTANEICIAGKVTHTSRFITTKQSIICKNYPNPLTNNTRFEFFIPEQSVVKIEIYSLLGEPVDLVLERQFEKGTHEFNYINPGLVPGTYIYKVSTTNQSLTQYLSILK